MGVAAAGAGGAAARRAAARRGRRATASELRDPVVLVSPRSPWSGSSCWSGASIGDRWRIGSRHDRYSILLGLTHARLIMVLLWLFGDY
jgi:hypothetical protein